MGYNAVTTAFTKYVSVQWGYDIKRLPVPDGSHRGRGGQLPAWLLSSRFGRKRVIQAGVLLLAACFGTAALFAQFSCAVWDLRPGGSGWAMINVNSYPMVVEISKSGDVGKYTGYYYTFSMAAQIVTPIVSGWLLEHVGITRFCPTQR